MLLHYGKTEVERITMTLKVEESVHSHLFVLGTWVPIAQRYCEEKDHAIQKNICMIPEFRSRKDVEACASPAFVGRKMRFPRSNGAEPIEASGLWN